MNFPVHNRSTSGKYILSSTVIVFCVSISSSTCVSDFSDSPHLHGRILSLRPQGLKTQAALQTNWGTWVKKNMIPHVALIWWNCFPAGCRSKGPGWRQPQRPRHLMWHKEQLKMCLWSEKDILVTGSRLMNYKAPWMTNKWCFLYFF